jgi:magnesium-transporting ATPase (P-type)
LWISIPAPESFGHPASLARSATEELFIQRICPDLSDCFQIGLFSNRYLIAAIAVSITLQMLATTLPFFQMALGTVAHSLYDWATIFAISSTVLLADELRKRVKKKRIKKY